MLASTALDTVPQAVLTRVPRSLVLNHTPPKPRNLVDLRHVVAFCVYISPTVWSSSTPNDSSFKISASYCTSDRTFLSYYLHFLLECVRYSWRAICFGPDADFLQKLLRYIINPFFPNCLLLLLHLL